jgi:hypothetical protein
VNTSASNALTVQNSDAVDIFRVRNDNKVLIGSGASTSVRLEVNGSTLFSGLVGVGVNPSPWTLFNAIDIGNSGAISAYTLGTGVQLNSNMYFLDGAGWKYKTTSGASRLVLDGNIITFWNAPSGTAGNTITLTQAMTLTAAGRLLLGLTAESTFLLDVNGTARVSGNLTLTASTNLTWGAANPGNNINRIILYDDGNTNLRTGIGIRSSAMCFFSYAGAGFIWRNAGDAVSAGGNTLGFLNENAQFAVNTTSANASAQLQVDSNTRGFLPPRMTNAQRTAISSPAVGLMVYCTDAVEGLYVYKSMGWTFVI